MRSLYEASGLGRIALGLQAWPRTFLRGNVKASDSDAENELLSLLAALKLSESPGLGALGRSASPFAEIAESRFAGLTAVVRTTASAAGEPAMSDPVVLLGRIPSAMSAPTTIGSSTPPAVAAICGCGYFMAPTQVLDQMAANPAHVHLSGQLHGSQVSGGADFVLTGQAGIMGASVSADMGASVSAKMSLQNVAPINRLGIGWRTGPRDGDRPSRKPVRFGYDCSGLTDHHHDGIAQPSRGRRDIYKPDRS